MNKGRATVVHPAPPKLSIAKQVSPSIQKKSSMIVDALAKTQSLGATPLQVSPQDQMAQTMPAVQIEKDVIVNLEIEAGSGFEGE